MFLASLLSYILTKAHTFNEIITILFVLWLLLLILAIYFAVSAFKDATKIANTEITDEKVISVNEVAQLMIDKCFRTIISSQEE